MAIPRLRLNSTALLVVDVQERLIATIHDHAGLVARTKCLVEGCALLGIPVIVTEQYVKGLGHTVAPIAAVVPAGSTICGKNCFSALCPDVRERLDQLGRTDLLICGIEAHICVMQTILDACAAGIQTFHATDCISAGQFDQIAPAMRRVENAGSIPTGTLSALYELMGSCEHPAFRGVLPIAKNVMATL